jgi:hypothetical protein
MDRLADRPGGDLSRGNVGAHSDFAYVRRTLRPIDDPVIVLEWRDDPTNRW